MFGAQMAGAHARRPNGWRPNGWRPNGGAHTAAPKRTAPFNSHQVEILDIRFPIDQVLYIPQVSSQRHIQGDNKHMPGFKNLLTGKVCGLLKI